MYYDIQAIANNCDTEVVANAIGMEVSKGKIRCPGHLDRLGKYDNRIGNAVLTKNGYHCFACGCSVSVFNMVMEHYKNYLGTEISFYDAVQIVAETCGGKEFYQMDDEKIQEKDKKKKEITSFILSQEELKCIGIVTNIDAKEVKNSNDNFIENLCMGQEKRYYFDTETMQDEAEFIQFRHNPYSIYSFYKDNKEACLEVFYSKINDKNDEILLLLKNIDEYNFNSRYFSKMKEDDIEELRKKIKLELQTKQLLLNNAKRKVEEELRKSDDFLIGNMFNINNMQEVYDRPF